MAFIGVFRGPGFLLQLDHQLLADMFVQFDCGGFNKYLQVLGNEVIATFIQQHLTDSLRSIMLYAIAKTLEQDEEIGDEDDDEDDDDQKGPFQQPCPCLGTEQATNEYTYYSTPHAYQTHCVALTWKSG